MTMLLFVHLVTDSNQFLTTGFFEFFFVRVCVCVFQSPYARNAHTFNVSIRRGDIDIEIMSVVVYVC